MAYKLLIVDDSQADPLALFLELAPGHAPAIMLAVQTLIDNSIKAVVGTAPAALDTLAEIATQLQADETGAGALGVVVTNLIASLGTAAKQPSTAFATAAQGAKADAALQSVPAAQASTVGGVKVAAALTSPVPAAVPTVSLTVAGLLTNAVSLTSVLTAINALQAQGNANVTAFSELVQHLKDSGALAKN